MYLRATDERGDFRLALACRYTGVTSPLHAEMLAARAAISFVQKLQAGVVELLMIHGNVVCLPSWGGNLSYAFVKY